MKYKIIFSVFFLISPICLRAEQILFRAISTSGVVKKIYYKDKNESFNEIKCNNIMRSSVYSADLGGSLEFYRLIENEDSNEMVPVAIGSVVWPNGDSPFLLIITETKEGYIFQAVEDSEASFPLKSVKILNGSSYKIIASIGDNKTTINPNQFEVLKIQGHNIERGVYVNFSAILNQKPTKFYTNLWNSSSDRRTLVLMHDTGNARRPVGFMRLYENQIQLRKMLNN